MRIVSLAALWVCSKQRAVQPQKRVRGVCGFAIRAKLLVRALLVTDVGNPHQRENVIFAASYLRSIPTFSVCAILATTAIPKPKIGIDANTATRQEKEFTYTHVRSGKALVSERR